MRRAKLLKARVCCYVQGEAACWSHDQVSRLCFRSFPQHPIQHPLGFLVQAASRVMNDTNWFSEETESDKLKQQILQKGLAAAFDGPFKFRLRA